MTENIVSETVDMPGGFGHDHGMTDTVDRWTYIETTYTVTCADGVQRHDGEFPSEEEASMWSEWGHACISEHHIHPMKHYRVEPGPDTGVETVDPGDRW